MNINNKQKRFARFVCKYFSSPNVNYLLPPMVLPNTVFMLNKIIISKGFASLYNSHDYNKFSIIIIIMLVTKYLHLSAKDRIGASTDNSNTCISLLNLYNYIHGGIPIASCLYSLRNEAFEDDSAVQFLGKIDFLILFTLCRHSYILCNMH